MQLKFCVLFLHITIFYNHCFIVNAMTGRNVRFTREGEFPMVVSIATIPPYGSNQDLASGHQCTGTLVTSTDILTVSHCLEFLTLDEVRIIVGAIDLRQGLVYETFWWIHYNEYSEMLNLPLEYPVNDIAFIKLFGAVSEDIPVAEFINRTNTQLAGKRIKMTSWSRFNNGMINYRQQSVGATFLSKENCDESLTELTGVNVNSDVRILCSITTPTLILEDGDSGAPALMNLKIAAITIGTCPTIRETEVQVNMHIGLNFYKQWILHMIINV